jgi:hypothetical protein
MDKLTSVCRHSPDCIQKAGWSANLGYRLQSRTSTVVLSPQRDSIIENVIRRPIMTEIRVGASQTAQGL